MSFLDSLFEFNASEALVEEVLDYVCDIFPANSSTRSDCDIFINQEYD